MKFKQTKLGLVALLAFVVAGCAASTNTHQVDDSLSINGDESAQEIIAVAAGYCKGMADHHGADFTTCFKHQTDMAIERIRAESETYNL